MSYLSLTGATGSSASTPDSSGLSFGGDIDLRVQASFASTGVSGSLIGQWGAGAGEQDIVFILNSDATLILAWLTALNNFRIVTSSAAASISIGVPIYLRATLDVDDGAGNAVVNFYSSADGATWTAIGTAQTAGANGNRGDRVNVWEIGANEGTSNLLTARVLTAEIRDGIAGTVVASPNFGAQANGATSFSDAQGNTWSVNSPASIVGATFRRVERALPRGLCRGMR